MSERPVELLKSPWESAGPADEARDGTLRRVHVGGSAVCLARVDGEWLAFADSCTHQECPLSDGDLEGAVVVCPCHASEFDVRTGEVLSPPALDPLPTYPTRVEGGILYVLLDEHGEPQPEPEPDVHLQRAPGVGLDEVDLTDLDRWVQGVP